MKFTILITILLLSISCYAQSVKGEIIDATSGETMIGTVVLLMDKSDTSKVLSTAAEDEGVFKFENVPAHTYILKHF